MKSRQDDASISPLKNMKRVEINKYVPHMLSLFDIGSMAVASNLPFEYVEKTLINIPDPVQERILYFSFPRNSFDIKAYSSFTGYKKGGEKSPYATGESLFSKNCVENVVQIGFHLTGIVFPETNMGYLVDGKKNRVSMTFDRCKITSVACTCNNRGLSWCSHAVALALFRINKSDIVDYKSPISDTLVKMDRSQLQKFAQYLIASHPNRVLASAQQLADNLLQQDSTINKTSGAPDPTAGAAIQDPSMWYLDESGVREQLRMDLTAMAICTVPTNNTNNTPSSMVDFFTTSTTSASFSSSWDSGIDFSRYRPVIQSRGRSMTHQYDRDSRSTFSRSRSSGATANHRPFAQLWLDNYRQLQLQKSRSMGFGLKLPSFFTSSTAGFSSGNGNPTAGSNSSPISTTSPSPLANNSPVVPGSHVAMMFAKACELLSVRDANGPRLLAIITEELIDSVNLSLPKVRRNYRGNFITDRNAWEYPLPIEADEEAVGQQTSNTTTTSPSPPPLWMIPLWEEVARLWTCLLLSPTLSCSARESWRARILIWSQSPNSPRDDSYFLPSLTTPPAVEALISNVVVTHSSSPLLRPPAQRRTSFTGASTNYSVFQLPLEAALLPPRDSSHLEIHSLADVVRSMPSNMQQCTCPYCGASLVLDGRQESFIALCLRVSSLASVGQEEEAAELAVSLVGVLLNCLDEVSRRGRDDPMKVSASSSSSSLYQGGFSVVSTGMRSPTTSNQSNPLTVNTVCGGSNWSFKSPPPPSISPHCSSRGGGFGSPLWVSPPHRTPPPWRRPPPISPSSSSWCQRKLSNTEQTSPNSAQFADVITFSDTSPSHETGWLGLPGSPIIGLVECLLEAAAAKKVAENSACSSSSSSSSTSALPHTSTDYIHLALKAGIVVLCQQRKLPASSGELMSCQAQETRLLLLLNTIPRDVVTAQVVGQLVGQLIGPPPIPYSSPPPFDLWWWSALGGVVHPDSYPVHIVTEFLFGHLLAGETFGVGTGELAYLLAARTMRFPLMESVSDRTTQSGNSQTTTGSTTPNRHHSLQNQCLSLPPLPSVLAEMAVSNNLICTLRNQQPQQQPPSSFNFHVNNVQALSIGSPTTTTTTNQRRDLGSLETKQTRLAISVIIASRSAIHRMDHFMRVTERHIHTALSLMTVSREVLVEATGYRPSIDASPFESRNLLPLFLLPALPTSVLPERINLVSAAFHLALSVALRTATRVHWRRREMLAWLVSTALLLGPTALVYLVKRWALYMTPREAVTSLAPSLLTCMTLLPTTPTITSSLVGGRKRFPFVHPPPPPPPMHPQDHIEFRVGGGSGSSSTPSRLHSFLPYTSAAREQICAAVRQMVMEAAAEDPVNCTLATLRLTEKDAGAFEAAYRLALDAAKAGSLGPGHLFTLAKYLSARGCLLWALPLAIHAMRLFSLNALQESHPVAQDVLWACLLAHQIGPMALQEMLSHVVRNIHSPTLLADILQRCRMPPAAHQLQQHLRYSSISAAHSAYQLPGAADRGKPSHQSHQYLLTVDLPPLKGLLEATINAFVTTTHARLANISPRQYTEFVEFLGRAWETFSLYRPDGPSQFQELIGALCHSYRGKRKLVTLLNQRFNCE